MDTEGAKKLRIAWAGQILVIRIGTHASLLSIFQVRETGVKGGEPETCVVQGEIEVKDSSLVSFTLCNQAHLMLHRRSNLRLNKTFVNFPESLN